MVKLVEVKKEEEDILYRLLQKYIYEMSGIYEEEMDETGDFSYPYLPYYFGYEGRCAYFICAEDKRVGFLMINTHSWTGEKIDHSISEFTIFPRFRQKGYALMAMEALTGERKGSFQLKYSTKNKAGTKLWEQVERLYQARKDILSDGEICLTFFVL